jgi:peptidoglycan hydrolase CwlO-like protein
MRKASQTLFGALLLAIAFIPCVPVLAQTNSQEYEAKLRDEEAKLQAEIDLLSKDVTSLQGQKATIEQAIALIDAQIKEAQAKIKLRTLTIDGLTKDIGVKSQSINSLEDKLSRSQQSLSGLIRRTQENDAVSLPQMLLSGKAFSDFFVEVDSFQTIKGAVNLMMEDVRDFKAQTQEEKATLESKKAKEADARAAIQAQEKIVQSKKKEQAELLSIKSGQLKTYQQFVSEKQARIGQIRSALFDLRGSEGIPFGDAYDYAVEASKATGVRPAFILAILTQESDLGKNVGSCLMTDSTTGNGQGKNTGNPFEKVMAAPRDSVPFLAITARLGKDWRSTPISCPPQAKYYVGRGFGGGMGPSQFIASTWELFKKRIGAAVGVSADQASPWNPAHAIAATAIYVDDLGAGAGGYTAERNAACRYYSGRACDSKKPANSFYGDQVWAKAQSIQANMIDPILGQ